jgi:hypothetical protein
MYIVKYMTKNRTRHKSIISNLVGYLIFYTNYVDRRVRVVSALKMH